MAPGVVNRFTYLGSIIDSNGGSDAEIRYRAQQVTRNTMDEAIEKHLIRLRDGQSFLCSTVFLHSSET